MNFPQVFHLLGKICWLVAAAMAASLVWTLPAFGQVEQFDGRAFFGILASIAVCLLLGAVLLYFGRPREKRSEGDTWRRLYSFLKYDEQRPLYRREAIAVVGLSWILASLLGALPFLFTRTACGVDEQGRPIPMTVVDAVFESASGFTGTGATVLTDLENPQLVPRAVLFWRSETHFLGGLGIMVLFVAILSLGSAGKALLLTEMPGPAQESEYTRTRYAAWVFASIFVGLNVVLTALLLLQGVNLFDALCHAFGTVATGGFSTYNKSVEHFQSVGIEMTIVVFMFLACTNFNLLYFLFVQANPRKLLADTEFRAYVGILFFTFLLVAGFGLAHHDFANLFDAVRYSLFQVTSIMTNTGFGTADFDRWSHFSRAVLVVLMFIGGCAGSTSCSVKVIRYVLLFKSLRIELEKVFRPHIVRHVRIGGKVVDPEDLRRDVLIYLLTVGVVFTTAFLLLVAFEPDSTWTAQGLSPRDKITDCASAVAATLNGVGPGLGIVGESRNYFPLQWTSKLVLTLMMLFGRLEIFVILVLFSPRFWSRW